MKFHEAFEMMKSGAKMKLPHWGGYWYWDAQRQTIIIHTKDGEELDIRETDRVEYTLNNLLSDDWQPATTENCPELGGRATFCFGKAIELMKRGHLVARIGWNGKGMAVAYQPGYPDGIPCNQNTAKTWHMPEGTLFKCNPYLQLRCADGTYQMWVASQTDILSDDWEIVE